MSEQEPAMPVTEMTDDMQMVTSWGVLRRYRDRIETLEGVNGRLHEQLMSERAANLDLKRTILKTKPRFWW